MDYSFRIEDGKILIFTDAGEIPEDAETGQILLKYISNDIAIPTDADDDIALTGKKLDALIEYVKYMAFNDKGDERRALVHLGMYNRALNQTSDAKTTGSMAITRTPLNLG